MANHYDYLVIGGGSGGVASARRAASNGAKTAVFENNRIGGTCVNRGCVPKKVMWNTARIAEMLRDAPDYGFAVNGHKFTWSTIKQARDVYIERLNGIYHRGLEVSGVDEISGLARFKNNNE